MKNLRKFAATGIVAGALVAGVAGPASATYLAEGVVKSGSCSGTACTMTLKFGVFSVLAFPDAGAYIWDCTAFGIAQGAGLTSARITTLKNHNAYVYVTYDQPAGYHDTVTCN